MQAKDCQDAFIQGLQHPHPRSRGAYKLRQCCKNWLESEAEVRRIARAVIYPSIHPDLRHCTFDDKAYWLRRVHLYYAYELSADILPSFEALSGDGLTSAQVQALMPAVRQACSQALLILEGSRQKIKEGIGAEYRRMKAGHSIAEDALQQVRNLIFNCITQLPMHIQTDILPQNISLGSSGSWINLLPNPPVVSL
jgi:hypothetical protein